MYTLGNFIRRLQEFENKLGEDCPVLVKCNEIMVSPGINVCRANQVTCDDGVLIWKESNSGKKIVISIV